MTSAYPMPTDELAEKVRGLAVELGEMPSRNRVMKTFGVGAPKASAALYTLRAAGFDPTRPNDVTEATRTVASPAADPADPVESTRHLRAVVAEPDPESPGDTAPASIEVVAVADPVPPTAPAPAPVTPRPRMRSHSWALLLIAAGAFVAIWGGWVGLGKLTGFGEIALLPGIADGFTIDSAITLPLGMEAYAAYALRVWLSSATRSPKARRFAKWSTIAALGLGAVGQVAYHLMTAAEMTAAPWPITTFVSCLPVVVLGSAAALTHLIHDDGREVEQ